MDGLNRAMGAPAHWRYKGRTIPIRFTLGMIGEIENWIIESSPSPYVVIEQLAWQEDDAAKIYEIADRQAVAMQPQFADLDSFLESRAGIAFVLWLNVRDGGDACEDVLKHVEELPATEVDSLRRAIYMAGGIDRMASLDWKASAEQQKDADADKFYRWRRVLQGAFESHGVMPEAFLNMTFYQLRTITSDKGALSSSIKVPRSQWFSMTPEERQKFIQQRKSKRDIYAASE